MSIHLWRCEHRPFHLPSSRNAALQHWSMPSCFTTAVLAAASKRSDATAPRHVPTASIAALPASASGYCARCEARGLRAITTLPLSLLGSHSSGRQLHRALLVVDLRLRTVRLSMNGIKHKRADGRIRGRLRLFAMPLPATVQPDRVQAIGRLRLVACKPRALPRRYLEQIRVRRHRFGRPRPALH